MEQPSAITDDNLPSPDQPMLDDLLRWSRQPKRFMSRGGSVDKLKDAENQVGLGRRHTQQDASSNANGRSRLSSKPTSQTHGEHRRTKSSVGTTGKLTRKNLGLGMGMQGTPPASVVIARNRSRSSSLTGLEGGGRGLIDFAPPRESTPIKEQLRRLSLKASRKARNSDERNAHKGIDGGVATGDGGDHQESNSSAGGQSTRFQWDGNEEDLEVKLPLVGAEGGARLEETRRYGWNGARALEERPDDLLDIGAAPEQVPQVVSSWCSPPSVLRGNRMRGPTRQDPQASASSPRDLSRQSAGSRQTSSQATDSRATGTIDAPPVQSFVVPLNDNPSLQIVTQTESLTAPGNPFASEQASSQRTINPPSHRSIPTSDRAPAFFHRDSASVTRLRMSKPPLPLSYSHRRGQPPVTPPQQVSGANRNPQDDESVEFPRGLQPRLRDVDQSSPIPRGSIRLEELIDLEAAMEDGSQEEDQTALQGGRISVDSRDVTQGAWQPHAVSLDPLEFDFTRRQHLQALSTASHRQEYSQHADEEVSSIAGVLEGPAERESAGTFERETQVVTGSELQVSAPESHDIAAAKTQPGRVADQPRFAFPPPSPLTFSSTTQSSRLSFAANPSFRPIWKDNYPDVIIPVRGQGSFVVQKKRRRGAGGGTRRTRIGSVLTSEEEEGIGQGDSAPDEESMTDSTSEEDLEPIRGKQPCRKKRACADTHADDERRQEERRRRIEFFKDLDENYELEIEWVV